MGSPTCDADMLAPGGHLACGGGWLAAISCNGLSLYVTYVRGIIIKINKRKITLSFTASNATKMQMKSCVFHGRGSMEKLIHGGKNHRYSMEGVVNSSGDQWGKFSMCCP